ELTKEQLNEIYSGKAKTWKDVNSKWPDKEIKAFSPDQSHGTYDFFSEEIMDKIDIKAENKADTKTIDKSAAKNKDTVDYLEYKENMDKKDIEEKKKADTNTIVQSVKKNKDSDGYFGYNIYKQNKDKLKEVKIKDENGQLTEPTKKPIQDCSYALSRPLYIYTNEKKLKDNEGFQDFMKFVMKDKGKSDEDDRFVALHEKHHTEQ